ncbi:MAG: SDR family oxidoreductase [Mucilaginibacter sp.]
MTMNLSNNKILITGGASGIGLGLTERFIQENNTVIICGRRESVLKEVADKFPSLITRVCDLSVEAERVALYNWIAEFHPDLNVIVNNAGIQQWMNISDKDFFERAKNEIITNIEAPIHLTSLFINLKSLSAIINVSSALAFVPLTLVPVYSATKAFFHSFTMSTRHLLKQKNIEVIEIIPPALNTDLGGKGIHDAYPPVSDFIDGIFQQLREGKAELTFGFSEAMAHGSQDDVKKAFERMNPDKG